jgi:hypothetical protein
MGACVCARHSLTLCLYVSLTYDMPSVVTVCCLYSLWRFGNLDDIPSPFSWQPGLFLLACNSCYLSHQYCALCWRHSIVYSPEDLEIIYKTTRKCSFPPLFFSGASAQFRPWPPQLCCTIGAHPLLWSWILWCPEIVCGWVSKHPERCFFLNFIVLNILLIVLTVTYGHVGWVVHWQYGYVEKLCHFTDSNNIVLLWNSTVCIVCDSPCSVLSDRLTDNLSLSSVPSGSVIISLLHGFIFWDLKSFPIHPMFLYFTTFIIHWHE